MEKHPIDDLEKALDENDGSRQVHSSRPSLDGQATPPSRNSRVIVEFRALSVHVTDTIDHAHNDVDESAQLISELVWHTLTVDEVATRLGVAVQNGLDNPVVEHRLARNGKNTIKPPPSNLPKKIFLAFFGGFGPLLLVASVVCFISWKPLGEPNPQFSNLVLAIVLLAVLLLAGIFNLWQDYNTSRIMSSIKNMLPSEIVVLREGQITKIPASDMVSGDVVHISMGNKIPADVRLIEVSSDCRFDRSILTGESVPVLGAVDATSNNFMESHNIALQGTICTNGKAVAITVGTGERTVFGQIAKQASSSRGIRTTLEQEVLRCVVIVFTAACIVAAFIAIIWGAWLRRDYPDFISVPSLLINLVSVAVALVPQGLPIALTLSLTVVARAMRRANVLCKTLSTVETLGAVSFICSDKTGTLTQNKMSVVNVGLVSDGEMVEVGVGKADLVSRGGVFALGSAACLCNDAQFGEAEDEDSEQTIHGDATDTGLLRFASTLLSVKETRWCWNEVGKLPFNSTNKFAVKLFKSPSEIEWDGVLLIVKGAPDILLPRCTHILSYKAESEKEIPLTPSLTSNLIATQENFASQGQRVLLIARRRIPSDAGPYHEENVKTLTNELCIVGLVALQDPLKEDARATVNICRKAGIRFAMVTGDFASTAAAIARDAGIFTCPLDRVKRISDLPRDTALANIKSFDPWAPESDSPARSLLLSGTEIAGMTESQWKQALTFDELVFARTTPQQKWQIVKALQGEGATVAVTGDGVNDAPALKQADVGVAVAGGSDVAIEAADLVLLKKFSDIVTGIEYGRLCFENLRKVLVYITPAGNIAELTPVLVNILFGLPQALSNIQMIIICVFTDLISAMTLIYEKPEADLLLRRPRKRSTEHLLDFKLALQMFTVGMIHTVTSMAGAYHFSFERNGIPFSAIWRKYGTPVKGVDPAVFTGILNQAQSIYFFNLVLSQWGNLLACRTRRLSIFQANPFWGPSRNWRTVPGMLLSLAVACFWSYVPVLQNVIGTRGIRAEMFFLPMAYGLGILFLDEMRKWWNRKYPKSVLARVAW